MSTTELDVLRGHTGGSRALAFLLGAVVENDTARAQQAKEAARLSAALEEERAHREWLQAAVADLGGADHFTWDAPKRRERIYSALSVEDVAAALEGVLRTPAPKEELLEQTLTGSITSLPRDAARVEHHAVDDEDDMGVDAWEPAPVTTSIPATVGADPTAIPGTHTGESAVIPTQPTTVESPVNEVLAEENAVPKMTLELASPARDEYDDVTPGKRDADADTPKFRSSHVAAPEQGEEPRRRRTWFGLRR